jgi:hypothetical protein
VKMPTEKSPLMGILLRILLNNFDLRKKWVKKQAKTT